MPSQVPSRESQYLVQLQEDGKVATVNARSHLGAVRRYLFLHPRTPTGSVVRVKERDVAEDWISYKVKR